MPNRVHVPNFPHSLFLQPVSDESDADFIIISEEEGTSLTVEEITVVGKMVMKKDGLTHKVRLTLQAGKQVGAIEDLGLHRHKVATANRVTA